MQFKNFLIISVLVMLIAFCLGTKLLGKNANKVGVSVFAPENYEKKEGEKLDDMMEQRRLLTKNMKIRNPISKMNKKFF